MLAQRFVTTLSAAVALYALGMSLLPRPSFGSKEESEDQAVALRMSGLCCEPSVASSEVATGERAGTVTLTNSGEAVGSLTNANLLRLHRSQLPRVKRSSQGDS